MPAGHFESTHQVHEQYSIRILTQVHSLNEGILQRSNERARQSVDSEEAPKVAKPKELPNDGAESPEDEGPHDRVQEEAHDLQNRKRRCIGL